MLDAGRRAWFRITAGTATARATLAQLPADPAAAGVSGDPQRLRRTCGLDCWAGNSEAGAVSCKDGVSVAEPSSVLDGLEQQLERTQSQLPTQSQSAFPQSQALAASVDPRWVPDSFPRNEKAAASSIPSSAIAMEKRRSTRPV